MIGDAPPSVNVSTVELKLVAGNVRLRAVALPAEHGGWSLLLEPIILGLLLVVSPAGLFLSVAALAAFLTRHPLKLALNDLRRQRKSARTPFAIGFAMFYGVAAVLAVAAASRLGGMPPLLPLLCALPLMLVQLLYDSFGRSRSLAAEMAGVISTGAFAGAIVIAGGWPTATAFALWGIIAARSVPTVLYLRARLRLLRRKPASRTAVVVSHVAACAAAIVLAWRGLVPMLAILSTVMLLVRAVVGFAESGKRVSAKRLGVRELCLGALVVFMVAIGYRAGW